MLSFYARVFLTYTPLLGLKGFLSLFFIVRYGHVVECSGSGESKGDGWVWVPCWALRGGGVTGGVGLGESQGGVATGG